MNNTPTNDPYEPTPEERANTYDGRSMADFLADQPEVDEAGTKDAFLRRAFDVAAGAVLAGVWSENTALEFGKQARAGLVSKETLAAYEQNLQDLRKRLSSQV